MKRKLFLLLCALLTMIGVQQVKADTSLLSTDAGWQKITELPATVTDYYFTIVDNSSDLMLALSRGVKQDGKYNSLYYKTSANSLVDKSMLFSLEAHDGSYVMTNVEYNGYFLQTEWNAAHNYRTHDNGGGSKEWGKINLAYQQDGYWTIQNGRYPLNDGNYLGVWNDGQAAANGQELALNKSNANKGTYQIYAIAKTSAQAYWDLVAAGTGASQANPVDMTSLIKNPNARFWTGSAPYGWTTTGTQNINTGAGYDKFPGIFEYSDWGAGSWTGSLKQTISVPNGKYVLKAAFQASAAVTVYLTANSDKSENLAPIGASGGNINEDGTETEMGQGQAGWKYLTLETVVSNGSLELGTYASSNAVHNWVNADNFTLTYYGEDLSMYETPLANAKTAATGINQEAPMNADVKSALQDAISTYGSKEFEAYTSVPEIQGAINALSTATDNANASISNYATALDILNAASTLDEAGKASYAANETVVGIQSAYNNRTLESVSSEQKTACATALRTAAKAQTTEGADMTLAIENWDFINCANNSFPGWSISTPNGGNAWTHGSTCVEYWIGSAANGSFDYYQTITGLPFGKYTISASMWNSANGEEGATVNGTAGVYATSGASNVFAGVTEESTDVSLVEATTEQVAVTNGTLRLGVKNNGTMGARWFGVDWIKLTFVEAISLQDYYDQITTLVGQAGAITGKQSDATATELSEAVTEGNALVSGASTDIDALNASIDRLTAAITASQTSVHSYAVIAAGVVPDNSIEGWVCENTNDFHINTWSHEGDPGNDPSGMVIPFIENWVGKGSYLGAGRVYYQLQGLNPGEVYYAQALVRSYNEANADAPNGPNFFINDDVVDMTEAGTTFTYNKMSGIYATLRGAATVGEDGTLTLGVEIAENRNYNWVAFKSISIRPMKDALKAAIESVEATIPAVTEIGDALFQYDATAVEARQSKISTAYEVYNNSEATLAQMEAQIEVLAGETTAIPQNAPDANKAYYLVQAVSGLAADLGTVKLSSEASPMFFAVEGNGYKISKDKANFVAYAGGNTWTLNTTTDGGAVCSFAYIGEGKYSITSTNGSFGTDNTTDGSSIYGNKLANAANSAWYIYEGAANLKVADGKLGTFVAPFDVTLPENVKAYYAKVDGDKVTLTKAANGGNALTAGTPVVVYGDGADVDETFYGIPTEDWTLAKAFDLWGILSESSKTVPVGAYVLQTQTIEEQPVQAFYKVAAAAPGALNRCYVKVTEPNSGNARLTIKFDDTTAINAIEAAEAEDGALKDGKYLIDGKIVIVKNGVKYSANGQILK